MGDLCAGLFKCGFLPKTTFHAHKMWVGESVVYEPPKGELVFLAARGLAGLAV